jgi:hypothetical protein
VRLIEESVPPPAELLDFPGDLLAFYPYVGPDDPVVVEAMRRYREQLAPWIEARAAWSAEHGWPDGDEKRLAEEEYLWRASPTI